MTLEFFASQSEFRQWLSRNHDKVDALWVGYYKKATGIPSITWPESVDEALCFGWIDGVRKSIDEQRYQIRFTPRRPRSNWSDKNVRRVAKLSKLGKMQPSGMQAFNRRKPQPSSYSYEKPKTALSAEFEKALRSNTVAFSYFKSMAPSFRKMSIHWVMSAKREETRKRRFAVLLESSEKNQKIPQLNVSKKQLQE